MHHWTLPSTEERNNPILHPPNAGQQTSKAQLVVPMYVLFVTELSSSLKNANRGGEGKAENTVCNL